nr:Nuclear valosin-containing protein [Ipomoea batatas]
MFRGDDYSQTLGIEEAERDGAYIIRWKSGNRVDPRLLTLLESFRDVFDKREDFFKKIFPGIYEEFKDVFGKFAMIKGQKREMKARALERSSSLGSARGLRLERFRVKTPNVTVVTPPQDGGGGQVKDDHSHILGQTRKTFPEKYEELEHVVGKGGEIKGQKMGIKGGVMERSFSVGSPRELKLERFKVKTPNVRNGGGST